MIHASASGVEVKWPQVQLCPKGMNDHQKMRVSEKIPSRSKRTPKYRKVQSLFTTTLQLPKVSDRPEQVAAQRTVEMGFFGCGWKGPHHLTGH